ncbi:MAG: CHRD domain-containing protein [Gemmatimonadota bacterium]
MANHIFGLAAVAAVVIGWTGTTSRAPSAARYVARMTGAQETPPNNTKAKGTASFTIDGTKLEFTIEVHDLTGPPTAAHIHVGAPGASGPPVYTFTIKPGAGTSGTISEGSLDLTKDASAGVSGDSLKTLLNNGHAYVNVHTKNFPGGETRGEVMKR